VWKYTPQSYGIRVTDKDIESYYHNHKAKSFVTTPTQVQVRRILVSTGLDSQLAQQKAQQIYMKVKANPSQFADLAKEFSDDAQTKQNGGLMPYFAKGEQEEIERTVFLLKEDGDISDIIRTSKGYEIIQRVHKKMASYKPLNMVHADIEKILSQKTFKEQFARDKQAIEALTAKKEVNSTRIEVHAHDNSLLAKNIFKTKLNETNAYVDDTTTTGVVIKVVDIHPSYEPAFDTVQAQVLNDLYEEKAHKQLAQLLEEAKKELSSASLEKIKGRYDGTLEKTGWILPRDEKSEELQKKGFPAQQMLQLEKVGAVLTKSDDRYGYLIRLDAIDAFNDAEFNAKKTEIKQVVHNENQQQWLDAFVASLYRSATIETGNSHIDIEENIQL
jgi:peptidyl-prolyl cis-trans isomerase D